MRIPALLLFATTALIADYVPLKDLTPEERKAVEAVVPTKAQAKPAKPRNVLITHITMRDGKPSGGHPSIPFGVHALKTMGERTGAFRVTVENDEKLFRAENLAKYDAIVFLNTVGVLTEDPALRSSLVEFVKSGKGFVGFHAAGATFVQYPVYDQFPEFGVMLGGYEDGGHPWSPKDTTYIKIDNPKSPLTKMFKGEPFTINDEAFQFREPSLRDRLHVLLSIDTSKMDMTRRILKQRQQDKDFPVSWIKTYGNGRVFYTTMGHNPLAFQDTKLLEHFLAGIQYALGDLKADATPR